MDVERLRKLRTYEGPDRVVPSTELWAMIQNEKPARHYAIGFPQLNAVIDGVEEGELIVITGPTAMGKTTFCSTTMHSLAALGHRSLFLTYEMSPKKFAREHATPASMIYLPLEHEAGNLTWLEDRCWEAAEKFGDLCAIFIDHLQYIHDLNQRFGNMAVELGATVRWLKRLAVSMELPIFLVAHMTKIPLDQEPSMHHLRDSGLIACEADTVLVIYRQMDRGMDGKALDTMLQNRAIIKAEKCRRTGYMGKKIEVFKNRNRLEELCL